MRKKLFTFLLALVTSVGMMNAQSGGISVTEFTIPTEWESEGTELLESDLPGFGAADPYTTQRWNEVPSTGFVYLIYAFESDGRVKYHTFSDGVRYSSPTEIIGKDEIYYSGATIYYTTGPSNWGPEELPQVSEITNPPSEWYQDYTDISTEEMPGFVTVDDEIVKAWEATPQGSAIVISSVGSGFKYHTFTDGVYQYTTDHSLARTNVYYNTTKGVRFFYTTGTIPGGSTPAQPSWVKAGDEWDDATKTLTVNSNPVSEAYLNNTEIQHVVFSESVTSIGEMSFWGCTNMTTVTIGNSVETIENNAFRESGLVTMTIGNGLTSIDYFAFCNCESLATLTCEAIDPPTLGGTGAFTGTYNLLHIYVPAGSVRAYKSSWTDKAPYIYAIGSGSANPEIKMSGNFSGSWADTEAFTDNGDGTATLLIELDVDYYNFGVQVDGVWTSDSHEFTHANPSYVVTGSSDVMWFEADVAGEYSFTWEYATNTLTLGWPTVAPTPSATGVIFANCYDCWRSPEYPTISGQCYLHYFGNPGVGNGNPSGPWKLEFVENYNSSSTEYDSNIVKSYAASEYGKSPEQMEVYRLYQWQNGAYQPVAYGVLYAYANENNAVEHAAFFEANGYWGCYFTDNTHSDGDNVYVTFNEDASTGFADLHGSTPTPAVDPEPTPSGDGDKLPGAFSVGGDKVVYFSKGNLQATTSDQGATWTWGFAENQWDYVGDNAANTSFGYWGETGNGSYDLFGWIGESSALDDYRQYGIGSNYDFTDYGNTAGEDLKADWGSLMGSDWRTLTYDEWQYLIKSRNNAANLLAYATVNGKTGLILLPDSWASSSVALTITTANYTTNIISASDWSTLEEQGCVFLPAAGSRDDTSVSGVGVGGDYWSSSSPSGKQYDEGSAYCFFFDTDFSKQADGMHFNKRGRGYGLSVRLVSETAPSGGSTPAVDPAVQNVIDLINAIPNPVVYNQECSNALNAVYDAYVALSEEQRDQVTNYNDYLAAEERYYMLGSVNYVIETINEIGNVEFTPACKHRIDYARSEYCNLTLEAKGYVTNYNTLLAAEAAYAALIPVSSTVEWDEAILETIDADEWGEATYTNGSISLKAVDGHAYYVGNEQHFLFDGSNSEKSFVFSCTSANILCIEITVSEKHQHNELSCAWQETATGYRWVGEATSVDLASTIFKVTGIRFSLGEAFPEPTPTPAQDGDKLPGAFSVDGGKVVYFSKGNLQYLGNIDRWHFAENQWTIIGNAQASNNRDLFSWGTGNNPDSEDYSTYTEWGNNIEGNWRTLTVEEWTYLFNTRTGASSKYGTATVAGVVGLILLPDVYDGTAINTDRTAWDNNVISGSEWAAYEAEGAVFLPAAGMSDAYGVYGVGEQGLYWSSTMDALSYQSIAIFYGFNPYEGYWFNDVDAQFQPQERLSVRLVSETAPTPASTNPVIKLNANFGGTYDWADTEAFTDNGDGTATLSNIALTAGYYYNFSVKVDGVSMSDNHEFTRQNPSYVISSGSGDVYYFQADVTGNYSFTWEYETNTLTIGYPSEAPAPTPSGDKLPGAFTVDNTGTQVNFSKGNVQYVGSWKFADNQWDIIGDSQADNNRDLFGWGTGSEPNKTIEDESYYTTFTDWGTNFGEGWRTLTKDEWNYLLETRDNAANLRTLATVNSVKGLILMPDGWTASGVSLAVTLVNYTSNMINESNWATLASQGCVFLPAAGYRIGDEVYGVGSEGYYFSSTIHTGNVAGNMIFEPHSVAADQYTFAYCGNSVRLVTDAGGSTPTPTTAVVIGDPNDASQVETFLTTYDGQTIDELIIDRPVKNNMYNTLCLPFDMNAAQIAASSLNGVEIREFTGASVEGTTLNLSVGDPVNAVVAGRPYFVKYSAASQLDNLHFEDVTINNALLDNMAVTFDGVTFKGTFTPFVMPNGLNFQGGYLFLGQNNQLFWPNTTNPLKPFRAYFYVNVESSTPGNAPKYRGMPARIVEGKNVATGVENAQSANQSTKVIVNGQLIIIKNDVRYNAQGQIVK